jgi:hypothetical protein
MATASLTDILNKGMAKLNKIANQVQAVKEGKPLRIKSAMTSLERIQKAATKTREGYIQELIKSRDEILGKDISIDSIKDGRGIANKAVEQGHKIIHEGWKPKALLKFELFILDLKEEVAEYDVPNLIDAAESFEDFLAGIQEYMVGVVAATGKVEAEKVKHLWGICMPEDKVRALSRASTPYDAIDVFRYDAVRELNKAQTPEEAQKVIDEFIRQINLRFKTWGMEFQIGA